MARLLIFVKQSVPSTRIGVHFDVKNSVPRFLSKETASWRWEEKSEHLAVVFKLFIYKRICTVSHVQCKTASSQGVQRGDPAEAAGHRHHTHPQ